MSKVTEIIALIRSQSDLELKALYAECQKDPGASSLAKGIESEYSRRHGWAAAENMVNDARNKSG